MCDAPTGRIQWSCLKAVVAERRVWWSCLKGGVVMWVLGVGGEVPSFMHEQHPALMQVPMGLGTATNFETTQFLVPCEELHLMEHELTRNFDARLEERCCDVQVQWTSHDE